MHFPADTVYRLLLVKNAVRQKFVRVVIDMKAFVFAGKCVVPEWPETYLPG